MIGYRKLYYVIARSLPLEPLDYQLIYAAHHLYPSFLLNTGIRRNCALAKYKSRTSEKITLTD